MMRTDPMNPRAPPASRARSAAPVPRAPPAARVGPPPPRRAGSGHWAQGNSSTSSPGSKAGGARGWDDRLHALPAKGKPRRPLLRASRLLPPWPRRGTRLPITSRSQGCRRRRLHDVRAAAAGCERLSGM